MNSMLAGFLSMVVLAESSGGSNMWVSHYAAALESTKATRQPLVVVLENPADPQQRVDQLENLDPTQRALLQPYVVCRLDVSTSYGQQIATAFKATRFPHTAVIDNTGSVILHRKSGKFTDGEWAGMLVQYKEGNRTVKRALWEPVLCRT